MGGFSFIVKICTYIGIIIAIPFLVFHLFKFLHPVMPHVSIKAKRFFLLSLFLAVLGIAFAYYVLLPAALRFLTSIDIQNVSAMLTVDAYLNFVTAYIIGSVVMFQIPVLLLLFNNITPIPPKKLMSYQKFIILGAFIFAAILSPTPDIVNQSLMALPMIVMYQVAVILVIFANRNRIEKAFDKFAVDKVEDTPQINPISNTISINSSASSVKDHSIDVQTKLKNHEITKKPTNIDGFITSNSNPQNPNIAPRNNTPRYVEPKYIQRRIYSTDGVFRASSY
jgi:sec-independent protein translocase protein TatC